MRCVSSFYAGIEKIRQQDGEADYQYSISVGWSDGTGNSFHWETGQPSSDAELVRALRSLADRIERGSQDKAA